MNHLQYLWCLLLLCCLYTKQSHSFRKTRLVLGTRILQQDRGNGFSIPRNYTSPALFMKSADMSGKASTNNKKSPASSRIIAAYQQTMQDFGAQWKLSVQDFKRSPWQYISIPITAAMVGYVTNWIGVNMLFYPIKWKGIPLKRWPNQPFGFFGWQGVVPTKRFSMTSKMVDVTINQLISIQEIFSKLDPKTMASVLAKTVKKVVYAGLVPSETLEYFLQKIASDMISKIDNIVDIRNMVINGMTTNPATLGSFFQRVGSTELKFLVNSGTYYGFFLGIIQMMQWMVYPKQWTLPVGGAVVGYITNWIALKLIFEPLNPTKIGPFVLQGLFLQRQQEVSKEFCHYIVDHIINSKEVWKVILAEFNAKTFQSIITTHAPFLTRSTIADIVKKLRLDLLTSVVSDSHPLHLYINDVLNLKDTLTSRMKLLTPAQFEQVLHPIFQEDELTLIVAGGVLGLVAGLCQMWINKYLERKGKAKLAASPLATIVTVPPFIQPSTSAMLPPAQSSPATPSQAPSEEVEENSNVTEEEEEDDTQPSEVASETS